MEGNIFVFPIRNALNNCGIRHVEYGTKRVQQNTRKRGINMLINIMSRFGRNLETESKVIWISI
jgi:ribonuclease-3